MRITRGLPAPPLPAYPVLTIGNFDGQHVGHRSLLKSVVETAGRHGGTPMVLSFDPHPARILKPTMALRFLTTREEKFEFFRLQGIQHLVLLEFNKTLSELRPEQFVSTILQDGLGVRDLLVGKNFVFGKGRSGNVEDLVRLGSEANFQVHPVSPVLVDGEIVSSTRIRRLIQEGRVKDAARCLGRSYCLTGLVVHGERRGTALGWPTANLRIPADMVIPADGVYVTNTLVNGESLESVSYIGRRPTFHDNERMLEVHLLDVNLTLYGETLQVNFLEHLRGDQEFPNVRQLLRRMEMDVNLARERLRSYSGST